MAIRRAVAAVLHVEAEHSGGRRLLRGAGVHFVPAFGLPFQTKTPLDSLTYRGARDTYGHTPVRVVRTNARSPPRASGGDAAASVRARVGTAWAVCSASPYRCSSVWHRIAGYSDARRRRQEAAVSKMAYFTALWHKAHASHASCAFFYVSVDRLQDVNYAHGLPALHAKWLTLSLLK